MSYIKNENPSFKICEWPWIRDHLLSSFKFSLPVKLFIQIEKYVARKHVQSKR